MARVLRQLDADDCLHHLKSQLLLAVGTVPMVEQLVWAGRDALGATRLTLDGARPTNVDGLHR